MAEPKLPIDPDLPLESGPLIDALTENLKRQVQFVQHADTKATLLLGLLGALMTVIVETRVYLLAEETIPRVLYTAALLLGVLATGSIAFTLWPRINQPKSSLLFFGTISALKPWEYVEAWGRATPRDLVQDLAHQAHANSLIARRKSKGVRIATALVMLSFLSWVGFQLTTIGSDETRAIAPGINFSKG